ncbi:tyrosine-protein phosphatase [Acetilactobacillus jinshanensis]|uniref:Tyrosine-protein phosphatase n=2 Tax=Acetilactobacillus jinshanensis TaxID=1720083 RepID=A0A4P6ZMQ6_9LACO|nr:tyrosine-protein phosphatase [Acetilactobacillus jinshanensis]
MFLMANHRLLNIKHGFNYRDVGGYPTYDGRITKWHRVVRAGNLAHLDLNEQRYLKEYGVVCDVDLRSEGEVNRNPDRVPHGVKYYFNPIHGNKRPPKITDLKVRFSNDPTLSHRHMMLMYRHMIDSHHSRHYYRRLFKFFLKFGKKGAVLLHCSQGKDRTGMGVAMLLLTLGVDIKTVKQDYLISEKEMVPYVKLKQDKYRKYNVNDNFMDNVKSLYTVSSDYFDSAMDEVQKKYSTWYRFEHKYLRLNDRKIVKLRRLYLIDPR